MIQTFNNKTEKVGDDIRENILSNSKLDIAAAIFSIYGFDCFKKELNKVDTVRFIFSDPAFIEIEQNKKENKEFLINLSERQKAIVGTNFEINLKNKLKGTAIAKECKKWIEKKVVFKTNLRKNYIQPHLTINNSNSKIVYTGINEFSSAGFGYEKDNSILNQIIKTDDFKTTKQYIKSFNEIWNDENLLKDITNEVADCIENLYKENPPEFIYFLTLYSIFNEFIQDITEDEIANEKTGFKNSIIWNKLYDFQRDAVLGIINKLERHNGCILADSVGLGKTYTALAVMKYYQERNRSVLVLCPKKLGENWLTFVNNYNDNPLLKDRFNFDVLYHTDLSRDKGLSNGTDLSRINWGNYDLVVIDESHNFRNNDPHKNKITRYQKLLNDVMKTGVKTKVLMLSATPVNNRFTDLKNQIALAFEGDTSKIDEKMEMSKSVDIVLRNAQKTFNDWTKLPENERTTTELLSKLNSNFDFFKLLDSVTIARSRKHIIKYYDMEKIGKFPNRRKPITHHANISELDGFMKVSQIYKELSKLNMSYYSPFSYIFEGKINFYSELYDTNISEKVKFKQSQREESLQILMRVNLLKRLESSIHSFRLTLNKYKTELKNTIKKIEDFEKNGIDASTETYTINNINTDDSDDWINDEYSVGNKIKINLIDMNTSGWKQNLEYDYEIVDDLLKEMNKITPKNDAKLDDLKRFIKEKIKNPINPNNKKVLIFSAFADTVNYLYDNIASYCQIEFNIATAKITGSNKNKCTLKIDTSFNNLLINFSPRSKERANNDTTEIDILIATDCISEGQNLQDCDTLINYDIHWNPVRIIQRFGRIDRIGSKNKEIQLINFWPQLSLDDYIKLKTKVESKMYMVDVTATGEDNVLTNKSSDLIFRKKQLEKLQEEVVDIEDMDNSISITDLGLNDFRMDLINYMNNNNNTIQNMPNGMHSVCIKDIEKNIDEGVIFVLKNVNNEINIDKTNQLHPFYLVYVKHNGDIISNHLNAKVILDIMRLIGKGSDKPIKKAYKLFNDETHDGLNMEKYSELLKTAIDSIINVKDESDVDSLFSSGGTTALANNIKGLEDFELITFLVIK